MDGGRGGGEGGRGEGAEFPKKTCLRPYLVVSASSTGVSNISKVKNVPLLVQKEECVRKMSSFDQGPLPPLST